MDKKFTLLRKCTVRTTTNTYIDFFDCYFTPKEVEEWMLNTYCIDESSVVHISMESLKMYYHSKSR